MAEALQASHLFSVSGLVAVVTGGGTGIGLMIAKALEANGATVYIIGRRREVLESAAKEAVNGKIIPIVGDVTSKESLKSVAARIKEEYGYVNVVFANSGIVGTRLGALLPDQAKGGKPTISEFTEAVWSQDMQSFTEVMNVNVTAAFYTAVAFLELLDAGNRAGNSEQKSQVIVITSIAGYSRLPQSSFAYSVSKAAANHMVKMLSTYFIGNEYDVRVNAIAPGLYPSEMTASIMPKDGGKEPWEEGAFPRERAPLRRVGGGQDMGAVALFLAGRGGAFINGNILVTDGGRIGQLPNSY